MCESVGLGCSAGREGRSRVLPPRRVHAVSIKGSLGKAYAQADPQLPKGLPGQAERGF